MKTLKEIREPEGVFVDWLIDFMLDMFRLIEGRIPENVCKVMATACAAGVVFSLACMEGPYTGRAVIVGIICMLLTCFFGTMTAMYRDVRLQQEEEDDLY